MRGLLLAVALVLLAPAHADEALWRALQQGGHVLYIRHSLTTPGFGDPPGFELANCATQRNLSDEGRAQARRMGKALRDRKVPIGEVLSSPWCRCVETAELAFGRAKTWDALSNLHARQQNADRQVRALRPRIARHQGKENLVLVAHGSVAIALIGERPAMGEILVLRPQPPGFEVVGKLSLP
jgi:broad specificity phosphatase PhoE